MPVADMFPSLRGRVNLAFSAPDKADLTQCDVVFFATPHGVAMAQAPELLARFQGWAAALTGRRQVWGTMTRSGFAEADA